MAIIRLQNTTILWKVAMSIFIIVFIGSLLFVIGFSTAHWVKLGGDGQIVFNVGLFEVCVDPNSPVNQTIVSGCVSTQDKADWWVICEILACLALSKLIIGWLLVVFGTMKAIFRLVRLGSISHFNAGVFGLTVGILFITKWKSYEDYGIYDSVDWSSIMFIIGSCLILISGIINFTNALNLTMGGRGNAYVNSFGSKTDVIAYGSTEPNKL